LLQIKTSIVSARTEGGGLVTGSSIFLSGKLLHFLPQISVINAVSNLI